MVTVSKSQFKAKALEFFRLVEQGEEVVVTDHGKKTIHIQRYIPEEKADLEALKGSILYYENPFEPAEEDWEALR
jgi:antitoxin (DNA-binding transcriptional repressor) of toxin-antitoxin stability system